MNCKLVVNLLTATLIITPLLVGCKKGVQKPTPIPGINPGQVGDTRNTDILIPPTTPVKTGDENVTTKPVDPNMVNESGIKLPTVPFDQYKSDNGETFKSQIV